MDEQTYDPPPDPARGSVTCRVCGAENRAGRLFCAECGTYLRGEEEDTWVDLPGVPAPTGRPGVPDAAAPSPTWQEARPSASGLAWDELPPPSRSSAPLRGFDTAPVRGIQADHPPRPPRRRSWLLAVLLVVLLLVAAGVTGAVAYRTLIAPDDGLGDGGAVNGGTSTTEAGGGAGSTTSTTPDGGTSTSTTSTVPSPELGEPVEAASTFASSTLPAEGDNSYRDRNVADGVLSTCWSEGAEGAGEGEWVRLDLDGQVTLSTIEIANGYQKDERRFYGNPRVETLRIEYSDGSVQRVRLHDDMGYQIVTPPPSPTRWVKLVIESTYPGDTWEDTSISEVRLYRRR